MSTRISFGVDITKNYQQKKPPTDDYRFWQALKARVGEPRFKSDRYRRTIEVYRCPSCWERSALVVEDPEWLPYPKPVCYAGCSDRMVFESLDLQELAFRGQSPPLVMCVKAKSYYKIVGRFPRLCQCRQRQCTCVPEGEPKPWKGACRTCPGCRDFTATYQAISHADALWDFAQALGWDEVWSIDIPERDRDKVLQGVQEQLTKHGGVVHHVPMPRNRRRVFATFGVGVIGERGFETFRHFHNRGEDISSYEELVARIRGAHEQRDLSRRRRAGSRQKPLAEDRMHAEEETDSEERMLDLFLSGGLLPTASWIEENYPTEGSSEPFTKAEVIAVLAKLGKVWLSVG